MTNDIKSDPNDKTVKKILKSNQTQTLKSTLITPQIFQSVHKNSPKHLRQRDKF